MTPLYSAEELRRALPSGALTRDFAATGISIDTRTLQPGDLFVALETETGDGHHFVPAALAKGAAGALVHKTLDLAPDAPLLTVPDTMLALQHLAAFARARFAGRVVAVTGSVGKTTTKEMLRTILSVSGGTHASFASYNNHWGVPLTLARLPANGDFAVIEIGMNHPGEIAPLSRLASPDIAVITAIAAAHIGHMGSLEAIADEKAAIADGLRPGGILVAPADSPFFPRVAAHAAPARLVGFGAANITTSEETAEGSDVHAAIDGTEIGFFLPAPGRHMVMNALAALTVAQSLGLNLEKSAAAFEKFSPVSGRGVKRPLLGGQAVLLDESYNASTASVRAALSVLRLMPAQRRLAVLGDMLELGDHSAPEHESLAAPLRDSADLLYGCGPWMKFLYDAVEPAKRGQYAPDSAQLAPLVARDLRAGDVVLVKGSFGSRMKLVVNALEAVAF